MKKGEKIAGMGIWEGFPILWIVPFLTYDCTRSCSYCYAHKQGKKYGEMSDVLFERFKDWCVELYYQHEVAHSCIVWLGGEPLLITDKIRETMDRCNEGGRHVYGTIFTNGDLVDKTDFNDLSECQVINVNISDTPLDECLRRIRVIRDRGNFDNETWVVTLDDINLDRIEAISHRAMENNIRLRFYRNMYLFNDSEYKKKLLLKLHKACDILEDYKVKGYPIHSHFLIDSLIPTWDLEDRFAYFCGRGIVTVHPDGSIGNCIRNMSAKVGTIWDSNPVELIKDERLHWSYTNKYIEDADCRNCSERLACQGGCPNDRLIAYGTYRGKPPWCEIHKEIIPRIKRLSE